MRTCEQSCSGHWNKRRDTAGIASSLHLLAAIAWGRGNLAMARSQEEESLALFKELGDKGSVASALVYLGNLIIDQGEYVRARSLLEDSLEMNKELGDTTSIADSLFDLARLCYLSQGDLTQAHTWLEESLALYQEWFLDTLSVPACLNGTVTSWFDTGEPFVVEYPQ